MSTQSASQPTATGNDDLDRTQLHNAAFSGQEDVVRFALSIDDPSARREQLFAVDIEGATPLHLAVRSGSAAAVYALLQMSDTVTVANVLETKDVFGLTPLHTAVRFAEFRGPEYAIVIRLLVDKGANVNVRNYSDRAALQEAARFKSPAAYDALCPSPGAEVVFRREPRDNSWADVRAYLSQCLWDIESVTLKSHMLADHQVHHSLTNFGNGTRTQGAHLLGETVYSNLADYVLDETREIKSALQQVTEEALPRLYSRWWARFEKAARRRALCFSHLERHWCKREWDEMNYRDHHSYSSPPDFREIYPIKILHFVLWKRHVLDSRGKVRNWLLRLRHEFPDGDGTNNSQTLLDSYRITIEASEFKP